MTPMANATQTAIATTTKAPALIRLRGVACESTWIVLVATAMGFLVNTLRSDRLPLVAQNDYQIMVPCPEPLGTAEIIAATDPRVRSPSSLVIDARSPEEFAAWHLPGAISIPFDWLAEQSEITKQAQIVARDIARSAKRSVVVYGDGTEPDPGHQWASLLNVSGIRNVSSVAGGAAALGGPTLRKEHP